MEENSWILITFETSKGEKVIDDFIRKQQAQTQAKIIHTVNHLNNMAIN